MNKTHVGELVQDLEFSAKEKKRLAEQVKAKGRVRKIFLAHAKKVELFKNASKSMEIPGFSVGRPGHVKKALEVVARDLTEGNLQQRKICWNIYRCAIADFVIEEQKNLNNLLMKVPVNDEKLSSEDLLRIICRNAKQYEVLPEVVEEFYELWGFERVSELSELLSICNKEDPLAATLKGLSELRGEVSSLKSQLVDFEDQRRASENEITSFREEIESLNEILNQTQKDIDSANAGAKKLFENLEKSFKKVNASWEKSSEALGARITKCEGSIVKLAEDLSGSHAEFKDFVSKEIEQAKTLIVAANREASKEQLNYLDQKLETKLQELKNSIPSVTSQKGPKYISPLIDQLQKRQPKHGKIDHEWEFINIFHEHLIHELDINLPLELITVIHLLFKSSNILLLDDDRIFSCWLRTLDWQHLNLNLAAAPSWIKESDWEEGVLYLFGNKDESIPRIVTIHHYNVALASCYLVPTLKMWSFSPQYFSLAKLVIIESGSGKGEPTSDLLEFATCFPLNELTRERTYPLLKNNKPTSLGKKKYHTGVDPEAFQSWFLEPKKEDAFCSDIDHVANLVEKMIPTGLKLHYARFRNEMLRFFSEEDSKLVSAYHIVLPWLEAESGDDSAQEFYTALKTLFLKPIDY